MNETSTPVVSESFTAQRIVAVVVGLPFTAFALLVVRNQFRVGGELGGGILGSGAATVAIFCWWFALRGHIAESRRRMRYSLVAGAILGGISFAAGFFGPIILTPKSNQGPLLGIFITGPLGFVVGAVIGWLYARIRASKQRSS